MPRLVVPGYPHHVTQRGARRQRTFFVDEDYRHYLALLGRVRADADVSIWAYCLMPNHVHLVVVPGRPDSFERLFRAVHGRYTLAVNGREGWRGHLWQERFHSVVLDERHLMAAVRYVELNPVRAALCRTPEEWPWSSIHAHLGRAPDGLVAVQPMRERVSNWREYLGTPDAPQMLDDLRARGRTGRPAGDEAFLDRLERLTGRQLRRRKPGPRSDTGKTAGHRVGT
jgi:putative transposase